MSDNYEDDNEEELQQNLYDPSLLDDDIELIENEIHEIDNLYIEVKKHFDIVKNSQSRGSLSFIEKQTTNLVNLKNSKLNWVREKINAKKSMADYKFKEANVNKKTNDGGSEALSEKIVNKIAETFTFDNKLTTINDNVNKDMDEELDNLLNEEDLASVNTITGDIVQEQQEDENGYLFAVDLNTNIFYKLDKDFNIIETFGEYYKEIVESVTIDEDEYVIDEDERYWLVIEITED